MEREGEAAGGRSMQRLILRVCVLVCAYTSLVCMVPCYWQLQFLAVIHTDVRSHWQLQLTSFVLLFLSRESTDTYMMYDPIFMVHGHRTSVTLLVFMKQADRAFGTDSCHNVFFCHFTLS